MDKTKKINDISIKYLAKYIFLLTPIIALILFLLLAGKYDIAPIGKKTIAWCDAEQQVIPLLNDFKDILRGKQSVVYNLNNAGGMSFFGVIFFFISSPFSFLVIFVSKSNMPLFFNWLVMFKIMTIAFASSFYLKKKHPNLNSLFNIAFSILYSFSGFVFMYYQNIIWLDLVYIFPLLLLSCNYLLSKENIIPYTILCALTVMINYYLGIIIIFFIILYMGMNIFALRNNENTKRIAYKFILASMIGALISMSVLIPSFIDYVKSARTISLIDSITNSWVLTAFETTIPLILGTIILIPLFFLKSDNPDKRIHSLLLILMTIPIIFDPINKMWHLGSYQSFPCRFAFINTLLFIEIAAASIENISSPELDKNTIYKYLIGFAIAATLIIFTLIFEQIYISKKYKELIKYSQTLWGNQTSLEALIRYYSIIMIIAISLFLLFKGKLISKNMLAASYVFLAVVDTMFSFRIYMASPSRDVTNHQAFYALEDKINDDSFYRVKEDYKIRNVNDLGALGYNSLGHYTSLTSKDYMFTMKKLGYSSYWMEVGPYGGSIFTDALMMNKYTIGRYYKEDSIYSDENYHITQNSIYPLGIVTDKDLSTQEELKADSRVNMQETLYKSLIDSSSILHTQYDISYTSGLTYTSQENNFSISINKITDNNFLDYEIEVVGTKHLYFEAFDKYSSSLYESINDSMMIIVNGKTIAYSYPTQTQNGTLDLGEFKDTFVRVRVYVNKDISGSSLSLFGIDPTKLEESISKCQHANMTYKNNKFKGNYESDQEGKYLFLPISYNSSIKAKINGKNAKVYKVFSSFVAIQLVKGTNNISISFTQKGLTGGILLSILGISLLGGYIYLEKTKKAKIIYKDILDKVSYYSVIVLLGAVFFAIYIFPIIINIIGQL